MVDIGSTDIKSERYEFQKSSLLRCFDCLDLMALY